MNRTTGEPQSGATVTLYKLGQAGMESVVSVKSNAQGKFHMDQTPQGPHLIQTAFDGVTYNHILPPGSATTGLSLDVYNSSKQPGGARITRHFLIFQPGTDRMSVTEGFIFDNDGKTTYNDPFDGTTRFYLPAGANGKVQVKATAPQGMPIDRAADKTRQKDVYKIDFPIKPGETSIQVTYEVPHGSGEVYEGRTVDKTEGPTLLVVPNGVTLKGDGVESKGQEPRSQASVYAVNAATYKVEIAGAMPAAADNDSGDNGPSLEEISPRILQKNMKWILALALGILALGFIVLYRAQPAAVPPVLTAKGKNARGRR
ncbi:MAG TPA: carboxypeptidase-like regulatory domain-containing protein [Bryobacteraceae bacterium]|nr:carboxypeptidase-like regulatory domain-containing protein [Bryobacteraceae bacterium]